jgi:hypothetical protein
MSITVASCWPFDVALNKLSAPPKSVFLAGVWTSPDPASGIAIDPHSVSWSFTTKTVNGVAKPHIRIHNIGGLPGGYSYKIRLLVVGE